VWWQVAVLFGRGAGIYEAKTEKEKWGAK